MTANTIPPGFKPVTLVAGVVCSALALALLVAPGVLLAMFGIDGNAEAAIVARRTAMLFVGYAMLAFALAGTTDRTVIRAFSLAMLLAMAGLALSGLAEFARGFAGPGIFVAIVTEAAFVIAYAVILRRTAKAG